jgi:hypothetical protein
MDVQLCVHVTCISAPRHVINMLCCAVLDWMGGAVSVDLIARLLRLLLDVNELMPLAE